MSFQKSFKSLILIGLGIIISQLVFAHAGHRGFVMLLPTDLFMIGGGAVVTLTFVIMVFVTRKTVIQKFSIQKSSEVEISPRFLISFFFLLTLLLIVWIGFTGNRDPLKNFLTMSFWVFFWIGLTLVSALFGNIWGFLSPWTAVLKILSKLNKVNIIMEMSLENSKSLSYWPAVILFSGFAWFELIHPSPMDPSTLAKFILLYCFFTTFGIIFLGGQSWLKEGDPFTVFFRMVGWLSPIYLRACVEKNGVLSKRISLRWPCAGLLRGDTLPVSGVAFVLLVLSTVSFDGLSKTFWWLSIVGVNPLEYPGRTSVIFINTFGLYFTFFVFAVLYYVIQRLSLILNPELNKTSSFIYSMIPIAFGYHFAHYLPTFIVDVQYAFIALSDPLNFGWNIFGTGDWIVTTSYLTNYDSVVLIWFLQVLIIVLAHVGAVIVSHFSQLEVSKSSKNSIIGQIPTTLLMIAYTVFGLWLLSTPVYS